MKFTTTKASPTDRNLSEFLRHVRGLYGYWGSSDLDDYLLDYPDDMAANKHIIVACLKLCQKQRRIVIEMPKQERRRIWGRACADGRIKLNPEMPSHVEAIVFIHEIAHHEAGHTVYMNDNRPNMKRERELVAETIAYLVLLHFGIQKLGRSAKYVHSYFKTERLLDLAVERQWDKIVSCTDRIIAGLEQFMEKEGVA